MPAPAPSPAPAHETFPGLWGGLWLVIASLCLEAVVAALLGGLVPGLGAMEQGALARLLSNAALFTGLLAYKRLGYRSLFHDRPDTLAATLVLTVPPVLVLVPALLVLEGWVQAALTALVPLSAWEVQAFEAMARPSPGAIVMVALMAPVLEEMLFRGVILRSLLRSHSRGVAIVHSAGLFGLAHFNLYQFVGAMSLGLLAGWLYERTRSLWPCIALHGGFNIGVLWLSAGPAQPDFGAGATVAALLAGSAAAWCLLRWLQPRAVR